jgi:hypothetical protein
MFIHHYFHFTELLLGIFAIQQEHLGGMPVSRFVFGAQSWNNPRQNRVQQYLIECLYGDVEIWQENANLRTLNNILYVDRSLAKTRINKVLEPLLKDARKWGRMFCDRVRAAVQAPSRSPPRQCQELRVCYAHRPPPRAFADADRAKLLDILSGRFGSVEEVDFGGLAWREQVRRSAETDILIGIHGNALTNLLWLPPHASVIELFPHGTHHYDYQLMAEVAGLTYFGLEAVDGGYVFREGARFGPNYGRVDVPLSQVPEGRLSEVIDLIVGSLNSFN